MALARALAVKPRVLLLDEPLSALDAKVRVQLRDQIRRIQLTTGTTTVFVTHDQEEALAVADRIGVMNKGKIEQIAAPQNPVPAPRHRVRGHVHWTHQPPARRIQWRRGRGLRPARAAARRLRQGRFRGRARAPGEPDAGLGRQQRFARRRTRPRGGHSLPWLLGARGYGHHSGEYQRWNKGEQLKATVQLPASELPAGLAVGDDVIVTPRPVAALAC